MPFPVKSFPIILFYGLIYLFVKTVALRRKLPHLGDAILELRDVISWIVVLHNNNYRVPKCDFIILQTLPFKPSCCKNVCRLLNHENEWVIIDTCVAVERRRKHWRRKLTPLEYFSCRSFNMNQRFIQRCGSQKTNATCITITTHILAL